MTAINRHPGREGESLTGACLNAFQPTQHDTNTLGYVAKVLIWKADGTIKFRTVGGDDLTLTMTNGMVLDKFQIDKIYDTGTTLADSEMACGY